MAREHSALWDRYENAGDPYLPRGVDDPVRLGIQIRKILAAIPSAEDLARCVVALKAILGADEYTDDAVVDREDLERSVLALKAILGADECAAAAVDDREHDQRRFIAEQAQIVLDVLNPKEAQYGDDTVPTPTK